ncbi:MAG: Lrp/AsnC family transcriptional regulator [Candidatus Thermoplasmatota archaeon]|nr:Lrp/AsnC family transcriptional regulator [Candidatus Thermoplasmatota archaeon]
MKIDGINKKILHLLQQDARMTYKEIAQELQRSETTIRDRIKAMEDAGIIQGYTALIDQSVLGLTFHVLILANPVSPADVDAVTEKLGKVTNVLRVYQVAGEHRLAIFMVAPSYQEFKEVLRRRLLPLGLRDEVIIPILEAGREFLSPLEFP